MTLPTFLGIGAPRSGTTWLHNLLATHPDIFMPPKRKDIRFFTTYYNRGLSWYEEFFSTRVESRKYSTIGEFSPDYLYDKHCAKRIHKVSSITKLILIVRNPTDRLFSKYKDVIVSRNYKGSFNDFIKQYPEQVEQGFYSRFIKEYLKHFNRSQFLVLIFEEAVRDIEQTKKDIGQFLEVNPDKFPNDAGTNKINASSIPKAGCLYSMTYFITSFLRNKCGFDRFVDWYLDIGRKIGARRIFGKSSQTPLLADDIKNEVKKIYSKEIHDLSKLLNRDLCCW